MEAQIVRKLLMAVSWLGIVLVVTACNGDSVNTFPSNPTVSSVAGGECQSALNEIRSGFADLFDQIEDDPSQTEALLSSVEMDNLFMSLGAPLKSVCGSAADSVYSDVVAYLSRESNDRSENLALEIAPLIVALCDADVHDLTAPALDACAAAG